MLEVLSVVVVVVIVVLGCLGELFQGGVLWRGTAEAILSRKLLLSGREGQERVEGEADWSGQPIWHLGRCASR